MSEAGTPAPASDLPTRFAAGVVMIAVAVVATWIGGWPFRILVAAAAAVMLVEWAAIHRVAAVWAWSGAALLAATLLAGSEYVFPVALNSAFFQGDEAPIIERSTFDGAWLGFSGIALLALLIGAISRRLAMIGGTLYIGIPSVALIGLDWAWFPIVFWLFLVTWTTDIFAYFAGRSIGGPKLAPRVSPNKTWSGLLGGVVGAAAVGWLAADFLALGSPFVWLGAPLAVVAQVGDLYESWVKRRAGVKDSGRILPGHGGVLDRLDGLLATALVTMIAMLAGLWTA